LNLEQLIAVNSSAGFNRLARFEVLAAGNGAAEIQMNLSDDFTQYFGYLHAGVIAALLDTACGFAASTVVGRVTASHFSMNWLRPAVGQRFVAKGVTLRAGPKQVFATTELFAVDEQSRGRSWPPQTLLVPWHSKPANPSAPLIQAAVGAEASPSKTNPRRARLEGAPRLVAELSDVESDLQKSLLVQGDQGGLFRVSYADRI